MNIMLSLTGIILFIESLMILDLQDLKYYLFITGLRFGRFQHGGGGELKDEFDVNSVYF